MHNQRGKRFVLSASGKRETKQSCNTTNSFGGEQPDSSAVTHWTSGRSSEVKSKFINRIANTRPQTTYLKSTTEASETYNKMGMMS